MIETDHPNPPPNGAGCQYADSLIVPRIARTESVCESTYSLVHQHDAELAALRVEQEHHSRRLLSVEDGIREQHAENQKTHAQIARLSAEVIGSRGEIGVISRVIADVNVRMDALRITMDSHLDQSRQIMLDLADRDRRRSRDESADAAASTTRQEKLIRTWLIVASGVVMAAISTAAIHAAITGQSILSLAQSLVSFLS